MKKGVIDFSLFSCEKKILQEDVMHIVLPGSEGEIQILPEHAPFFCHLGSGMIIYMTPENKTNFLFILGGIAMVDYDTTCVVADRIFQSSYTGQNDMQKAIEEFRLQIGSEEPLQDV